MMLPWVCFGTLIAGVFTILAAVAYTIFDHLYRAKVIYKYGALLLTISFASAVLSAVLYNY